MMEFISFFLFKKIKIITFARNWTSICYNPNNNSVQILR